jgi:hypothetical protein
MQQCLRAVFVSRGCRDGLILTDWQGYQLTPNEIAYDITGTLTVSGYRCCAYTSHCPSHSFSSIDSNDPLQPAAPPQLPLLPCHRMQTSLGIVCLWPKQSTQHHSQASKAYISIHVCLPTSCLLQVDLRRAVGSTHSTNHIIAGMLLHQKRKGIDYRQVCTLCMVLTPFVAVCEDPWGTEPACMLPPCCCPSSHQQPS